MPSTSLWQVGLIVGSVALAPACSKKASSDEPAADDSGAGGVGGTGTIASIGASNTAATNSTTTDSAKTSTTSASTSTPLASVVAYQPSVLPMSLSISMPTFLMSKKAKAALRLAEVDTTVPSVKLAADGSAPNGVAQLANTAQQAVDSLSGAMYDAMLLDQNWDKVKAECGSSFTTCHLLPGTIQYTVTPEVVASVVSETGGLKDEESAALALEDGEASAEDGVLSTEEAYTAGVEDGYDAIYSDMFATVNSTVPNPETFVWLGAGDDNPCTSFGNFGVRIEKGVDKSSNETMTLCWNPETKAVHTTVTSNASYESEGKILTSGYELSVSFDPATKKSVFESSYFGTGYEYATKLSLTEGADGLTISGLTTSKSEGYKSTQRQTAFVDQNGGGYVVTDDDLTQFNVTQATATFPTVANVFYRIFPTGANPLASDSVGSFSGNGTTSPDYVYFTGSPTALAGLDVHACDWLIDEQVQDKNGKIHYEWSYACTSKGKVTLVGSETTSKFRYKEYFGEETGWAVIDPETGDVMSASDAKYFGANAFAEYEEAANDAAAKASAIKVTAAISDALFADLTDNDADDTLDPTGGRFFMIRTAASCDAVISEDENSVLDSVGQTFIASNPNDGMPFLDNYVWSDVALTDKICLYYQDYADLNEAGYAKLKLVPDSSVSVAMTEVSALR